MNQSAYKLELFNLINSVPEQNRHAYMSAVLGQEKNPVVLYGFNIWLGFFGLDRFLVGDVVAGILKLLTLGGFGIWQLIDCFLIGSRARTKNIQYARQLKASFTTSSLSSNPDSQEE